jgi:branched-chain amino acid transport system substrate-binding protein
MEISSEEGMSRREFVVGAGAAAAGLAIGGAAGYGLAPKSTQSSGGTTTKQPIHIAAAYPMTGWGAGDGAQMKMGIEMGVSEINASGGLLGRQLVVDFGDIEDVSADKVVSTLQYVLRSKPAALFMGYTTNASAEYPIMAEAGIPSFHNNTFSGNSNWVAKDLANRGNIFQICPNEKPYAPAFAALLQDLVKSKAWTPSKETAAIVTSLSAYSLSIANAFQAAIQQMGWKVSLFEKVNSPNAEWGPILSKIRQDPPGVIFHSDAAVGDLASFTKQFRSAPTPSLLYEVYGPSVPEYLKLTGSASDGVLWSTVIGILPDAIGKKYVADFTAKFNQAPGSSLAGAQRDAVMLWWSAAARAGDPTAYARVLNELKTQQYRGVCGSYNFGPPDLTAISYPGTGDPNVYAMDPSLGLPNLAYQIQNGQQVLISPEPYTQGAFDLPPWMA